jgi:transcriptional regulator with XRE-family HTH domain
MVIKALPAAVDEGIKALGNRIRLARQRRGWTLAEVAEKAGITLNTLSVLERGKPGVALGTYVAVLWVLGLDRTLQAVAAVDEDSHGKTLESSRRPQRVRKRAPGKNEYDF